mgnify:CR=1 FL=1
MDIKVCLKCNRVLSVFEFYQYKTGKRKGTYFSYCFECRKENDKSRYGGNINKLRKKKALWKRKERKNKIEKMLLYERNRRKNRILENSAMGKVHSAVESGRLKKPRYCRSCGQEIELQAHHRDYNKPLKVIWLCSGCHKFLHSYIAQARPIKVKEEI